MKQTFIQALLVTLNTFDPTYKVFGPQPGVFRKIIIKFTKRKVDWFPKILFFNQSS